MAAIPKAEIPAYVRKCWESHKKADIHVRDAEIERLKFYVGDQWTEAEKAKRLAQNRPFIVINKCKPAVDQIEGDIRLNPPGPQVHPVGEGTDGDTADIIEGMIRETEYRSGAQTCYATAGKYSAASGFAALELATEFVDDRSFSQQLRIDSVEDPSTVFIDPTARKANREDAGWGGKLKMYSKSEYIGTFGDSRRVLQPTGLQRAQGWISDALGLSSSYTEWTGKGEGPFYVAEFYMVEVSPTKLRLYSDKIARYDDEPVPAKVTRMEGEEYTRIVPRRRVRKYVVDALEVLDETDWLGGLIPIFPVLGPEVYINGKLHRLSLISGALDSNRALNFTANTLTEIAGSMSKSPYIGPEGTFDDPRWATANTEIYAYLEYKPVHLIDPGTGNALLAPAPTKNTWGADIQWALALWQQFSEAIKEVTGIYDPSLGKQKGDQSGKAIEQLRSESNVGSFSYADNLHRAIAVMYNEMVTIMPKIYSSSRAVTIIRPDSQHEMVNINQIFHEGIDPATGKKGKANNISQGRYSVRVTAGPSFQTRQEKAVAVLSDIFKANPALLQSPGVAAKFIRMVGEGNPQVEAIADMIAPQQNGDASPAQMGQQLQAAQQQVQQLQAGIKQIHDAFQQKLPELEFKKFQAQLDSLTKIRVAEISASKDRDNLAANIQANHISDVLGFAHDAGQQAVDHEQAAKVQQQQQDAAAQTQASDQAHQQGMAAQAAEQQQGEQQNA